MNKSEKAQLKQYITEFKFVPGGRYLYYAGRPHKYFNNCFMFNTLEDSREDWAQVSYKVVNALMTGGGLGVEYSTYRPEGSLIKRTGGFSSGPIPKMEMTNEEGRRVMQGGSRRSALWAGLNWQHADARKLIYAKDWHNIKIPGTNKTVWDVKTDPEGYNFPAPLDMTNISLCYDDEWLEQIAFGELPRIYIENVRQALKTGEPGFAFNFGKNSKEILRNACTELTSEDDSDVCNIGSLNLAAITTKQELNQVIELATKFLICGTLGADLPFEAVYKTREKNRRLGLGIMGFHEWLLMRGYRYEVVPEMHLWLNDYQHTSNKVSAQFADHLGISRPVKNRAIAPTGTIGILAGTTTGIEPMFAAAYKRRYLKGTDWHYQYVVDPIADRLAKMGANTDEIEGAIDLARDPERRIKAQYDIQKYVDHAISSTINLPAWGTEDNNEDKVIPFAKTLAKYAHGLRGFTCYPDGARGGQPLTSVPYSEAHNRANGWTLLPPNGQASTGSTSLTVTANAPLSAVTTGSSVALSFTTGNGFQPVNTFYAGISPNNGGTDVVETVVALAYSLWNTYGGGVVQLPPALSVFYASYPLIVPSQVAIKGSGRGSTQIVANSGGLMTNNPHVMLGGPCVTAATTATLCTITGGILTVPSSSTISGTIWLGLQLTGVTNTPTVIQQLTSTASGGARGGSGTYLLGAQGATIPNVSSSTLTMAPPQFSFGSRVEDLKWTCNGVSNAGSTAVQCLNIQEGCGLFRCEFHDPGSNIGIDIVPLNNGTSGGNTNFAFEDIIFYTVKGSASAFIAVALNYVAARSINNISIERSCIKNISVNCYGTSAFNTQGALYGFYIGGGTQISIENAHFEGCANCFAIENGTPVEFDGTSVSIDTADISALGTNFITFLGSANPSVLPINFPVIKNLSVIGGTATCANWFVDNITGVTCAVTGTNNEFLDSLEAKRSGRLTFPSISAPASGTAIQNTGSYNWQLGFSVSGGSLTNVQIAPTVNSGSPSYLPQAGTYISFGPTTSVIVPPDFYIKFTYTGTLSIGGFYIT
ncbi:unnamed protein product [Sphagnum compactum]